MNTFQKLTFLLLVVVGTVSCQEDASVTEIDLLSLNGTWTGTSTILKKGSCVFSDSVATVVQVWNVTAAGAVSIEESFHFSAASGTHNWIGTVDKSLNVSVTRTQSTNCFGTLEDKSFTLTATIQQTSSGFKLDQKMDFPLCPPACLFDQHYLMIK